MVCELSSSSSRGHRTIIEGPFASCAPRGLDWSRHMVHSRHTTKVFDADLQELARAIAEMGGLAERQIAEAIEALTTRESAPARRIVAADATIDAMQRNIEKRAVETIARRQPVAGDLREIVGKRIIAINGEDVSRKSMRGVCQMAALMLAQLRDVLDSFACRDVAKAVEVWMRDQDIDRLCTSLSQEFLAYMMENSVAMSFGAHLMFCAKNLERMGDHATNIAEAVHYIVKGETLLRERPKADFTSMLTVAMART